MDLYYGSAVKSTVKSIFYGLVNFFMDFFMEYVCIRFAYVVLWTCFMEKGQI